MDCLVDVMGLLMLYSAGPGPAFLAISVLYKLSYLFLLEILTLGPSGNIALCSYEPGPGALDLMMP